MIGLIHLLCRLGGKLKIFDLERKDLELEN